MSEASEAYARAYDALEDDMRRVWARSQLPHSLAYIGAVWSCRHSSPSLRESRRALLRGLVAEVRSLRRTAEVDL